MNELTYITFQTKYHRDGPYKLLHPLEAWVDCNGYLTVDAPSYEKGRAAVIELLGRDWAFDQELQPLERYAPLGELAILKVNEDGTWALVVTPWEPRNHDE